MQNLKRNRKRQALGIAVVAAAIAPVVTVHAQEDHRTLEEVIVTAERRAVSVQDIPISAVALSGSMLDNRGVTTFEQLQYQVPSLTFSDLGNTKFINIRGVGVSEASPNQTAGVAVHLDGGYIAKEFVYGDAFFDIASVEVLRGPQGTYSGHNASGGAIFINSQKPVLGETSGFVSVDYGNYDRTRLGGAVSFPLTESLAARISLDTETRDSFYKNHGPDLTSDTDLIDNQPGNLERSFGRFQLLYSPSDELEARLIYERSKNDTDGTTYKFFAEPGTNTLPSEGLRKLNLDLAQRRDVDYERSTIQVDWAANEHFRVLANVSFLQSEQRYLNDNDRGSPLTNPDAVQDASDFKIEDDYWVGEITLVSESEGPLVWTVGASMLDYQQDNYLNFYRYNTPTTGFGLSPVRDTRLFFYLDNIRKNKAVFGEVGYDLTPELQVKVGLRYNDDEVGFTRDSYISAGPPPAGRLSHYNAPSGMGLPADELLDFDATTGRAMVNWRPNGEHLYYATVSRGYKPGGTTPFAIEYDSEEVTNYEVGWKGSVMDDTINTSVSAFYMEYDQFQRTFSPDPDNPAAAVTRNIDGTTIKGVEAQLSGWVSDFRWDLSFAYSKGEYGNFELVIPTGAEDTVNPVAPQLTNLDGDPIDYLPERSLNFGVAYEGIEFAGGRLIPSVRVSYQDEFYTTFYQFDYNLVPSKTLVDLFLAYESEKDWRFEIYAKNATDKKYISRAAGGFDGAGEYLLGNPREIGAKLRYNF